MLHKTALMRESYTYRGYVYEFKGARYPGDLDIHHVRDSFGNSITFPWSHLTIPSETDFKIWIDLGLPNRECGFPIGHIFLIHLLTDRFKLWLKTLPRVSLEEIEDTDIYCYIPIADYSLSVLFILDKSYFKVKKNEIPEYIKNHCLDKGLYNYEAN